VVVILTGEIPSERAAVGRALAADVGWRFEDAAKGEFHRLAAMAAGRREPLVIAGAPLDRVERNALRAELRPIRFVELRRAAPEHHPFPDLAIDPTRPIGAIIAVIRNELGI
jgi:hypothetical protein